MWSKPLWHALPLEYKATIVPCTNTFPSAYFGWTLCLTTLDYPEVGGSLLLRSFHTGCYIAQYKNLSKERREFQTVHARVHFTFHSG